MLADARAGVGGWRLVEQFDRHRKGRTIFVARYVDNVRNDCRSRRPRPRAGALEEQPADEIALGDDRVEGAGDIGERMVGGDQAGLDLLIQSPRIALRHAEQADRSEEHTSELQSLMRISYAVFCLKKKNNTEH